MQEESGHEAFQSSELVDRIVEGQVNGSRVFQIPATPSLQEPVIQLMAVGVEVEVSKLEFVELISR